MPPGCAYTFYFFLSRLFYFGRDSCFYLCQWRDFFYLARLFLLGATFLNLARLFLFGATFLSGMSFMPAPGYGPYAATKEQCRGSGE